MYCKLGLAFAAALLVTVGARAAEPSFFDGKVIQLYTGNSPGGGTDVEMRLVAKHLRRFIPGNPAIVARYMPGAGGAVLGNFLYRTAPDGLTLSMPGRSGFLLSNLVPQAGVSYELAKFSYVGSSGGTSITLWVRKALGVTSARDWSAVKKEVAIGALAPRSQSAVIPRVLVEYHKWPVKVIAGYPGFNEVFLGIESTELDGLMTNGAITRPELVTNGVLIPILQSNNEIAGVTLMSEIVSDPEERALLGLLEAPSQIGLPLIGPPGIADDRLIVLRKAFQEMAVDREYRTEAEALTVPLSTPIDGPALQKMVQDNLTTVPDAVVKKYIALTEK